MSYKCQDHCDHLVEMPTIMNNQWPYIYYSVPYIILHSQIYSNTTTVDHISHTYKRILSTCTCTTDSKNLCGINFRTSTHYTNI